MAKKIEPPGGRGACIHGAVHGAMMLLLAFFIAMLAQCSFGPPLAGMQEGIGGIRDAFGSQAAWGILPFLSQADKTLKNSFPAWIRVKEEDKNNVLIAHARNSILKTWPSAMTG